MPRPRRRKPRSPSHQAFGEAITQVRKEADLTLEEFAEQVKLRFQLVSEMERGLTDPKLSTLLRFSEGVDVKLSELYARMEKIEDGERGR